jgi:hypothetical protein
MTKKPTSGAEIDELSDQYEQVGDEEILAEWERAARRCRSRSAGRWCRGRSGSPGAPWSGCTRSRTRGAFGVTQLIREWTEQRLAAGGELDDRVVLADELERAARLLRETA